MAESTHPSHPSVVQVRHINPDDLCDHELLKRFEGWLDMTERARLARLIHRRHRHSFLVSHALTRKVLSEALGCNPSEVTFGQTGNQKPKVTAPLGSQPLHFNLTHTDCLAAVAVSSLPVGIDVEWLGRANSSLELAQRYFTVAEHRDIQQQPAHHQHQRFLTYWTLKEAFLKAQAWGITESLQGFEFDLSPANELMPQRIRLRIQSANLSPTEPWRFRHWQPTPHHVMSLALSARLPQPVEIDVQAWTAADWR